MCADSKQETLTFRSSCVTSVPLLFTVDFEKLLGVQAGYLVLRYLLLGCSC